MHKPKTILMKKAFTILLLIISSIIYAQENDVSVEEFYNNSSNWSLFNEGEATTKISGGNLLISCGNKYTSIRIWKSFAINQSNDFYIEGKIKQVSGNASEFYGLAWGCNGWSNSFSFDVSSSGKYRIWGYESSNIFNIKQATASSLVKGLGIYNTLAIKKTGTKIMFYINGTLVFTDNFKPFYGNFCGFVVGQGTNISADYFKLEIPKTSINLITSQISKYNKENMGTKINSPYSEIAPVISPDGKTLYVARSNHPQNIGDISKFDIWYSELLADGTWTQLKNIGKPLNNSGDNVVISVSPDNNTLLLETLYNSDGSFKSDQGISVTHRNASGGWSIPSKVEIENYYNRNIYESFCPSANRKVLIMSVERDDGLGEKDLFVSFLKDNGTYSKPKNMGNVLNSFNEEGTPYLAPDDKTLYFYSYTQPGYGSADIFMTKRLDDTWTNWSKPQNLGTKINTADWDVYYTVSAKGDFAYLVSTKGSFGNEDIYTIKLRDEEKPDPVVLVSGKVIDKKTKKPIGTQIVYENLTTGEIEGYAESNPQTGEYKIILPYGIKYEVSAKKKDYFAVSEDFDLRNISEYKELKKDLYMIPLEKEETILLENVLFYSTKATLLPESYPELNRLVKLMKDNPIMVIELHGHTESTVGFEDKLMELSKKRVAAVKAYMVLKGIEEERIHTKAFGGSKPIAQNDTEEGRQKNRRVEFKIIKK